MSKHTKLAETIIDLIGGKENISNVFHCMTRLRLNLKDQGIAKLDEVEKTDGVLGINVDRGEIQIIIGPAVDEVYSEVIRMTGLERTEAIDENLDEDLNKSGFSPKAIFDNIINTFSATMNPLVPMFVLVGMTNLIAVLIGPSFLNLVSDQSDIYNNFYFTSQAILYFLPFFLAVTAARHFKTNVFVSIVMAAILLYPNLVTLMSAEGVTYTVYGIPATAATYSTSVIPILLIVWAQKYIEKLVKKIVPDVLKVVLEPLLITLIMLPIALCALGPLGTLVGDLLAQAILWLNQVAGPIELMLVGMFVPFMTAFGIGRPVFFICMTMLFANGVEYAYMPIAMVITNFIAMGVSLGYTLKTKIGKNRELGLTCLASVALGGVSEPTWFGLFLPNKKLYVPAMIGGGLAGLILGIFNVGYYQFGPSNILSVLGYVGGNSNNFMIGCIAAGVALIVTAALSFVVYKDEK